MISEGAHQRLKGVVDNMYDLKHDKKRTHKTILKLLGDVDYYEDAQKLRHFMDDISKQFGTLDIDLSPFRLHPYKLALILKHTRAIRMHQLDCIDRLGTLIPDEGIMGDYTCSYHEGIVYCVIPIIRKEKTLVLVDSSLFSSCY